MHEKVKEYLESHRAAESSQRTEMEQKEKRRILLDAGLYERVYADESVTKPTAEYPNCGLDENGKERFFKEVTYDVTEEEYEEIKEYVQAERGVNTAALQLVRRNNIKVPEHFSDLKAKNAIAVDIWDLANTVKVFGIVLMILCFVAGLIATIATEEPLPIFIGIGIGIGTYIPYWIISRLIYALSIITQSTKTTADALLYKLGKEEK